jgi:hypothetical protein
LPGVSESPRRARIFLLEQLDDWGWKAGDGVATLAEQGQLILTELVTNAVRHAPGRIGVSIEAHHDRLTLSVTDAVRPARPLVPLSVPPSSQSGRGLTIVDSLSSAWGVRAEPVGKTVWAELAADAASWPADLCV